MGHGGLKMLLDNSTVKCYFLDTGLLISHSFDEGEVVSEDIHGRLLFGDIALNEGMLTENVVAQMLTAAGRKLYFFSRSSGRRMHRIRRSRYWRRGDQRGLSPQNLTE